MLPCKCNQVLLCSLRALRHEFFVIMVIKFSSIYYKHLIYQNSQVANLEYEILFILHM